MAEKKRIRADFSPPLPETDNGIHLGGNTTVTKMFSLMQQAGYKTYSEMGGITNNTRVIRGDYNYAEFYHQGSSGTHIDAIELDPKGNYVRVCKDDGTVIIADKK